MLRATWTMRISQVALQSYSTQSICDPGAGGWVSLFVWCCFMSSQHLRSYQNSYQLGTAHTQGLFAFVTNTMTWYPTQSHYPDSEPTSRCLILIMPIAQQGNDQYQFWSHWFDTTRVLTREVRIRWSPKVGDGRSTHSAIASRRDGWVMKVTLR